MRKQMLATLLIGILWMAAGIAVAYSTWYEQMRSFYPNYYADPMLNPFLLGLILFSIALVLTFIVIRALLPSRTSQRRKLLRLLDEVGIEEVEAIQRKLNTLSDDYGADAADHSASLESLLREEKRKNRA